MKERVTEILNEKEKLAAKFFYDAWYSAIIYNSLVDDLIAKKEFDKVFEIEKKLKSKYPDLAATKEIAQKANTIRAKVYSVRFDAAAGNKNSGLRYKSIYRTKW